MSQDSNNSSPYKGFMGGWADDQTKREDRQEYRYHDPQVYDGFRPISTWSHDLDRQNYSVYQLRQVLSSPHTFAGWVRLFAFPMFGGVVKWVAIESVAAMGMYAAIPIGVIVIPLIAGYVLAFNQKQVRYPATMKYTLMLLGGLL